MTTSDRREPAQADLFDGDAGVGKGHPGRCERAVRSSIDHAVTIGLLGDADLGMAGLALEAAAAVDLGHRRFDPYAVAAAGRELREILTRLKLDPSTRPEAGDSFDELVKALGAT